MADLTHYLAVAKCRRLRNSALLLAASDICININFFCPGEQVPVCLYDQLCSYREQIQARQRRQREPRHLTMLMSVIRYRRRCSIFTSIYGLALLRNGEAR